MLTDEQLDELDSGAGYRNWNYPRTIDNFRLNLTASDSDMTRTASLGGFTHNG